MVINHLARKTLWLVPTRRSPGSKTVHRSPWCRRLSRGKGKREWYGEKGEKKKKINLCGSWATLLCWVMTSGSNAVQPYASSSASALEKCSWALPCASSVQQSTAPLVWCHISVGKIQSQIITVSRAETKDYWGKGAELNQNITTLNDQNTFAEYMIVSCIIWIILIALL